MPKRALTMKPSLPFLALLFLAAMSFGKTAQSNSLGNPLFFKQVSKDHGVSQHSVIDVIRSSDGYYWIATQSGLNRYDGYEIKVFKHSPNNANSISDDFIWALAEDKQGNLWIGTRAGGLSKYDPDNETFTNFLHDPTDPTSISSNEVTSIAVDTQQRIWAGTANEGLNLLQPDGKTFRRFKNQKGSQTSLNSNTIKSITPDKNGKLWIGFSYAPFLRHPGAGACYFDTQEYQCKQFRHIEEDSLSLSSNQVTDILIDQSQQVWISTFGGGLNLWQPKTQNFKRFSFSKDSYAGAVPDRLMNLHQDLKGTLWMPLMGTGLIEFDPSTYDYFIHQPDDAFKYSLGARSISYFYEYDGQLIVGSWRDGFYTSALSSRHFKSFMRRSATPNSHLFANISHLSEDSFGRIWIANRTSLFAIDETGMVLAEFNVSDLTPPNSTAKNINFVFCDSQDRVWYGSNQAGLFSFEPNQNLVPTNVTFHADVSAKQISAMLQDPNGDYWIGTKGRGLFHYAAGFDKVTRYFSHADGQNRLDVDIVAQNGLAIDKNNHLWIATLGKGITKLHLNTKQSKRLNKNSGLSHNSVTSVLVTAQGQIWAGTQGGGVNAIMPKFVNGQISGFEIKHYRTEQGLASNNIGSLLQSSEGAIWLSTSDGISRILPDSQRIMNLFVEDGTLPSYSIGVGLKIKNSKLMFGGFHGLTLFNGAFFGEFNANQKPLVNQLYVNNKPLNIGLKESNFSLEQSISNTQTLQFNANIHQFGFSFTGMEFSAPNRIKFAYQLTGYDNDWIETNASRRYASYTNIQPGKYTFKLKATNKYGEWLPSETQINISILSSPWVTPFAISMYVLLFILLILTFWQLYYKQRAATAEKNKQIAIIRKLFENTSESVWLLDQKRRYVMVNQSFLDMTGTNHNEIIGTRFSIPEVMEQPKNLANQILDSVDNHKKWHGQLWDVKKNGTPFAVELRVDNIQFAQSSEHDIRYIGTFTDVTAKIKNEHQLHQLAYYDDLTQLPNRSHLHNVIEEHMNTNNENYQFGLLFIDLDDFKIINDSLGHDFGDQVLQALASRMKNFTYHQESVFARLGGDEFLVYIPIHSKIENQPHNSTESFLRFQAQRIINLISQPIVLNSYQYRLTSSVGISCYPEDGTSFESLMRNADIAMYQSKNKGRNRVCFYTPELNVIAQHRFDIAEELKVAIEKEQFEVHFQPKFDAQTNDYDGVEVLARWTNEKLGPVNPIEFISTAEEIGLIGQLGEQIMTQACTFIKTYIDRNQFNGRMSVNLSPAQFRQKNLIHVIDTILEKTQFPAECLEIEITESMVMSDFDLAKSTLDSFKKRNIEIAIDDFGTGYSSMSYLCQYPMNTLKIDRSFVSQLNSSNKNIKVVESMIKLAHTLGLKVVAEGVETQQQLTMLRNLSCDLIQGFYFAKPMPKQELETFLKKKHRT